MTSALAAVSKNNGIDGPAGASGVAAGTLLRPIALHQNNEVDAVTVAVLVYDQVLADRTMNHLAASQDLNLLPVEQYAEADVVLVLTTLVTDGLLARLDAVAEAAMNPDQAMVLVSGPLRERHLARALRTGVVSILPRADATPRMIARAVVASGNGRAMLPETVTRWLVDEARMFSAELLTAKGLTVGGLTVREVEVLKMLADGHDTMSIADGLNYSERTIKKDIQKIMTRLGLRSRAHAVSYALRAGVI